MANLDLVKVGQGLTAAILNGIIGRVNRQALTGIAPGAVVGGGGTVTVAANGMISFVNATNVFISQAFTSDYANYRFVWNSSTRSAAQSIQFRHTAAGSEWSSPTYAWLRRQDQGTASSVTSGTASTAFPIDSPAAAGLSSVGYLDLFAPAVGTNGSSMSGLASMYDSTNGMTQAQVSARNTQAQAFDGFNLFPTSGTFTGSLRIYGYNNLV